MIEQATIAPRPYPVSQAADAPRWPARRRLLVAQDEDSIADTLRSSLEHAGYDVSTYADGAEALRLAYRLGPDLIVLDLTRPALDGLGLCQQLRQDGAATAVNHVPILVLGPSDEEVDKVIALELGADDYVSKPFGMRELLARVKALLRRSAFSALPHELPGRLVAGDLVLDTLARTAMRGAESLALTTREFDLLAYLVVHPQQALTRERLARDVWQRDLAPDSTSLEVHVRRLRSKIEPDASRPMRISTIRGLGYRFDG